MTSSIKDSSISSPESTVSSLLASCSVGSNNPCANSLIQYKDKLYSSASEALEAYIEDFDLSLTSSEVSTGKICICQSTPKKIKFSKHHAKEKHALDDFEQHLGLVSPVSPCRRQPECDPDVLSLATDDLLAFPADGSLPFGQRGPLKPNQQGPEWSKPSPQTSFSPYPSSKLNPETRFAFQENGTALAHQNAPKNWRDKKHHVCTPDQCDSLLAFEANSNTLNYPRWLTQQKSDLSVSGLSSIPNFPYPIWLKSYNLCSDSAQASIGQTFNLQSKASSSQTAELLKNSPSVDENSLNLLEQNDCLDLRGDDQVKESCSCANLDVCFQLDNSFSRHIREDLFNLKTARGLESSAEDVVNNLENNGSPSTTEILGGERSWENAPGAFKPPVPVCCEDMEDALPFPKADIIQKFLDDCLNDKNKANPFCEGDHHRPLEALKLMLFKLQAIQGSLSQNESAEQKEEFEQLAEKAETELQLHDSEIIPLTNSIQKALHHLSHLKNLVEEKRNQQEQTDDCEEDKEGKKKRIICETDN